jgi:hypothetical protein
MRASGQWFAAGAVLGTGVGAAVGAATGDLGTGMWIGGMIGVGLAFAVNAFARSRSG